MNAAMACRRLSCPGYGNQGRQRVRREVGRVHCLPHRSHRGTARTQRSYSWTRARISRRRPRPGFRIRDGRPGYDWTYQAWRRGRKHPGDVTTWQPRPVPDQTLRDLYDLLKWAPTSANTTPARFALLRSTDAKERAPSGAGRAAGAEDKRRPDEGWDPHRRQLVSDNVSQGIARALPLTRFQVAATVGAQPVAGVTPTDGIDQPCPTIR
jgi:hypothetical protein